MLLMPHSELTRQLLQLCKTSLEEIPAEIDRIIRETGRGGVNQEGGFNDAVLQRTRLTSSLADVVSLGRTSGFRFGASSEKELIGVKPELVRVVRRALELSSQDFMVFDGVRSFDEQHRHVQDGTSKTMKSKHLGGLAVDLVPYSNGMVTWDWNLIWPIAFAMDRAATEQSVAGCIRWGGVWDMTLANIGENGKLRAYEEECKRYASRHPGKDFLDGPHFEWVI